MDFRYERGPNVTHISPSSDEEIDTYDKLAASLPSSSFKYVKEVLPHIILVGIVPRREVFRFMRAQGIIGPISFADPKPAAIDVPLPPPQLSN